MGVRGHSQIKKGDLPFKSPVEEPEYKQQQRVQMEDGRDE